MPSPFAGGIASASTAGCPASLYQKRPSWLPWSVISVGASRSASGVSSTMFSTGRGSFMSTDRVFGALPSGSLRQLVSRRWSIAISGLWSSAVSLACAPAGSSPVRIEPAKTPPCADSSRSGRRTTSPLLVSSLIDTSSGCSLRSWSPSVTRTWIRLPGFT